MKYELYARVTLDDDEINQLMELILTNAITSEAPIHTEPIFMRFMPTLVDDLRKQIYLPNATLIVSIDNLSDFEKLKNLESFYYDITMINDTYHISILEMKAKSFIRSLEPVNCKDEKEFEDIINTHHTLCKDEGHLQALLININ